MLENPMYLKATDSAIHISEKEIAVAEVDRNSLEKLEKDLQKWYTDLWSIKHKVQMIEKTLKAKYAEPSAIPWSRQEHGRVQAELWKAFKPVIESAKGYEAVDQKFLKAQQHYKTTKQQLGRLEREDHIAKAQNEALQKLELQQDRQKRSRDNKWYRKGWSRMLPYFSNSSSSRKHHVQRKQDGLNPQEAKQFVMLKQIHPKEEEIFLRCQGLHNDIKPIFEYINGASTKM